MFPLYHSQETAPMNSQAARGFCCSALSAANFFRDTPWFNVPKDRKGEILIEPLYPRGGLLGGSSKQDGAPKSKLAALAAARKAKENQKQPDGAKLNSSVALLDKLAGKSQGKGSETVAKSQDRLTSTKISDDQDLPKPRPAGVVRKHTKAGIQTEKPKSRSSSRTLETSTKETTRESSGILSAAAPSVFAHTIFYPKEAPQSLTSYPSRQFAIYGSEHITKSHFLAPSPDDVVLQAQNSRGNTSKTKKIEQPPNQNARSVNEVTKAVKEVNFEETKVKGQYLDVVMEYKKSKPKNAANFVVIGNASS